MPQDITINKKRIGRDAPVYIIAELSANHNQNFDQAVALIDAAKEAGADAVKIQTYTPDTMTLNSKNRFFRIGKGTIWEGKNLYDLYGEACTPWEWHADLKRHARKRRLDFFSTPFDHTAVDLLENLHMPVYKIASFEIVDIPLIRSIARTGKPIILSTGMASVAEIDEAVQAIRAEGNNNLALLKCTSAYPALPEEMNLRTIPHMAELFDAPVGLSDHTLGISVPVAAVTLGACIVEKHFTLSRGTPGPDSAFSLEPAEFRAMTDAIRDTEKAIGRVSYDVSDREKASRVFRRSLFVVREMKRGEIFTAENVRSIRPGYGIPPKYLPDILGRRAEKAITRGTPLRWDLVD
jgi:N-acetylneuraminate synthase